MIEIIVEKIDESEVTTGDRPGMAMPPTMKKKKKYETFKVSDDVFSKFRNGKTKFERWSKYLDLKDESQKKIYDYAKRHHNGIIILQNATTGVVRGIRFNRNGGGQWGKLSRLKEQILQKHDDFTRLQEDERYILLYSQVTGIRFRLNK